jgi:hypothetical protein
MTSNLIFNKKPAEGAVIKVMKKILLLLSTLYSLEALSQVQQIDFGTGNSFFTCDPPVYTTTGQSQCTFNNPFVTPVGSSVIYTTTASGSFGQDCRNWARLSSPGFSFIGTGSEIQLRNAGNGSTIYNPARFLVKNFTPGTRFGIAFDIGLAGYSGAFYFQCGSGQAYGDTLQMLQRDTSSFMTIKIDGTNPAVNPQPSLRYSSSAANTMWPNVPSYSFVSGISGLFPVYQKHSVAIFCNNTNIPFSYSYIGTKSLNPQSYDVYLDSVLDVDNMVDNLFGLNRAINSFMFSGADATCANGGPYLGDTLIVDNIRWSSDLITSPLPVKLTSFTAQLTAGNIVKINWHDETPSDQNSFEVQVSTDGRNFNAAGTVVGKSTLKDYSFSHPITGCGTRYFRLKFDGTKYSGIATVLVPCNINIQGSTQSLRIQTKNPGTLFVTNSQGQILAKKALASGYSQVPLVAPVGIYIAKFVDKQSNIFVQKIVLQ